MASVRPVWSYLLVVGDPGGLGVVVRVYGVFLPVGSGRPAG